MFGKSLVDTKTYGNSITNTRMLSLKYRKIHGMEDPRWTIWDRLNQYRGILKLYERDKKRQAQELVKLNKKVSNDLKTLKTEIKQYREIVRETSDGDKRRLQNVLQDHKDLLLAYRQSRPDDVCQAVFQDNSLKRRQLDKLYYQKKRAMKLLFNLKVERVKLAAKYEEEQKFKETHHEHQQLITRYHDSLAKHNAARSIYMTYLSMIKILKNDEIYFDAVFDALKNDQISQCNVILKAILMGQLAAENLDDIRRKYKRLAKEVWFNMKERQCNLQIIQKQVKDLQAYTQSLVRTESNNQLTLEKESKSCDANLENQIKQMEAIFNKVKSSFLVRSYRDIYSRLEEQTKQREHLLTQYNIILAERDAWLKKKNHALLILTELSHSTPATGEYNMEMKRMLEQIAEEKKRETDFKNLRKSRGEILLNVKSVLQNMIDVLICVQRKTKKKQLKKSPQGSDEEIEKTPRIEPKGGECQLDKIETDALAMLATVTRKALALFAMANFELHGAKEENARDLYQTYVSNYHSHLKFDQKGSEVPEFYMEHDVADISVPTRKDIKFQSKRVLEAHTKIH